MRPLVKQMVITAIVLFLAMSSMLVASLAYTDHGIKENNKAWCDVINTVNKRYETLPPNAPDEARELAKNMLILKHRYDC